MNTTTNIYAIRDNHWIRYVGKTVHKIEVRLAQHLKAARDGDKSYRGNGIRKMLQEGRFPTISLLEVVHGNGSKEEIKWIAYFRNHGIRIWNMTDGGEGIADSTGEVVKKRMATRRANGTVNTQTPASAAKISATLMGHPVSEETKNKIREARKHQVVSKDTIEKMHAAVRGKSFSEEHKKKIGLGNKGKVRTLEMRKRYSLASKRRPPRTLEQRAEIAKRLREEYASGKRISWNKGLQTPDEVRKKISLSMTGTERSDTFRTKMRMIAKAGQYAKHFK
jgi:hypothetical protein